ncbi:MAG: hypothetical protein ACPH8S_06395 [Poseidonia sp.]
MFRPTKPQGSLFQVHRTDELTLVSSSDRVVIKEGSFSWGDLLFSLPFVAFGLLFIGVGLGSAAVGAYGWWMAGEEHCVFSDDEPLFAGDGTAHCLDHDSQRTFERLEVSEDRFRYSNGDAISHFRWSAQGDYIFIAEIQEDGYVDCDFYRLASSLPTAWSTEDLTDPYIWSSRPSWCNDVGLGNDEDFSPTESAPFDGERLYRVFDSNNGDVYYLEFTNNTVTDRSYMFDANDGLMGVLFPLVFSGFGVFMLRAVVDFRNFQLTLNRSSNSMQWHKAFAGTRFTGWNWEYADFTSLKLHRTTQDVHYGGGDDHEGYTSEKSGDLLTVQVDGDEQPLVFFVGSKLDVLSDTFLVALAQAVGLKAIPRMDDANTAVDEASSANVDGDGEDNLSDSLTPETTEAQEPDSEVEKGAFWSGVG